MHNKIHSESNSTTKSETDVKSQRNSPRLPLKDLQQNREELDRCKKSPVYFYNMYVRREGQPVLTEDEYKEKMKVEFHKRNTPNSQAFNLIDDLPHEILVEVIGTSMLQEIKDYTDKLEKAQQDISNSLGIPESKMGKDNANT